MKIGIITRRDGFNIGTSLQAFAIQQVVFKLGYENLIIDYCEYSLKARIRYFLLDLIGYLLYPLKKNKYREGLIQRKKFRNFDDSLIKTDQRYYYTIPCGANIGFNTYICGSDQIWNPNQVTDAFLLDFVKKGANKIAYAPSMGVLPRKEDYSDKKINLISSFDFLSCREYDGMNFLKEITGKKCQLVLDPTLLLSKEEWRKSTKNIRPINRYVLCYFLGNENLPIRLIKKLFKKK